jgi:8-oxo-dGTP pyrophosphatase MutT (NUDIX family)
MVSSIQTETQISAGGVAHRRQNGSVEIALISVGTPARWQLPKGIIDEGETSEQAALREVREEAGINTELETLVDKIEYWYVANRNGERIRYHKFVYFYLLRFVSGDTSDHDHEVNEARWTEIGAAIEMLSFKSERIVVEKARDILKSRT